MQADYVIRGGTIVDGTGGTPFIGDVAVRDGLIVAVGGPGAVAVTAPAGCEFDAKGLLVTPGWVDVHTHYDGQATWDPLLAQSSAHGVTTVVAGNCGVGFAPCLPQRRQQLVDLMDAVSSINHHTKKTCTCTCTITN